MQQIAKLISFTQMKFILSRPCPNQPPFKCYVYNEHYLQACTWSSNVTMYKQAPLFPNCWNQMSMTIFYLWQITSWHVCEFLQCELLQACWKNDVKLKFCMTCELCTIKLTKCWWEVLHVTWIFPIVRHGSVKSSANYKVCKSHFR